MGVGNMDLRSWATAGNRGRCDLAIFQAKLAMDGMKDVVLSPLSLLAASVDLVFPGKAPGHRFYSIMGIGERFDRWLCLFPPAAETDDSDRASLSKLPR